MIVLANPEDCEQVRHPDDILNLARREDEVKWRSVQAVRLSG